MNSKNLILLAGITAVLAVVLYSFFDGSDDAAYVEKINKIRKEKDHYMRTSSDSPFAGKEESFSGLNYFDPNPQYRISASLNHIHNPKTVILPTSDGKDKRYLEYAYAEFDFEGEHIKLLILEIMEMGPFRGTLFLAFGDATSAIETYGAGRYLDIRKVPGSTSATLDFNEAYNPYCAYNDDFSCPLPPKENLMNIAVNAGEKNYK